MPIVWGCCLGKFYPIRCVPPQIFTLQTRPARKWTVRTIANECKERMGLLEPQKAEEIMQLGFIVTYMCAHHYSDQVRL